MKLKIIAIGIVLLLVCTALPMVATAAPVRPLTKTVQDKVYMVEWSMDDTLYHLGAPTGKVTVNIYARTCNIACSNLVPNAQYYLGISQVVHANNVVKAWIAIGPSGPNYVLPVRADANGRIFVTGVAIPQYALNYYLQGYVLQGGYLQAYRLEGWVFTVNPILA